MRKLLVLITGLAVAAAVALAAPGSASAAQYNVFQTEDGLCMGVQGGNMNPGTVIITWTCDDSLNQFWSMDWNSGSPNYFLLRNGANPNECLSVFEKATYFPANLVIWPCKAFNDNQDQRWFIPDAHSVPIYNFNSGLQILPSGPQGSAVVQWDGRVPYDWTFNDFVDF
jgi:hypothetical protein